MTISTATARPSVLRKPTHTGLALLVVVTGVLIAAVDTTIVVLALPVLERSLHVPLSGIIWVIIAYLLVMTILSTQVGRLGDMFGRVRMYEVGFGVFVLGSLLCALATNEATIIGFRILQGVGGALISANSGAVIADTFPAERRGGPTATPASAGAPAPCWASSSAGSSPPTSPGAGSSASTCPSVSPPSCLLCACCAIAASVARIAWMWPAWRSSAAGSSASCGPLPVWPPARRTPPCSAFSSPELVLLVAFVAVERRQAEPMLDLSLFRVPTMTPTLLAALLQSLANFATLFLVTMYLQGVRQLTPLHAALVLVPGYLVGAFIGPLAGRLADRLGPVYPATVGLAIQCLALAIYANLGLTTSLWVVIVAAVINGIGSGAFFPANNAAVMKAARVAPSASPRACCAPSPTSAWCSRSRWPS